MKADGAAAPVTAPADAAAALRAPEAGPALAPAALPWFRELPRGGAPEPGESGWVRGEAGSEREGTRVVLHLRIDAGGTVTDARFQAFGCPHTLAVAAWLSAQLPGRPVAGLQAGTPGEWAQVLAVPVEKLGRLLRLEDALQAAVAAGEALRR
ncbi:MAG: iron-sulfur cluster assembly scaffold protein [Steroidobacteraceae bacterium]